MRTPDKKQPANQNQKKTYRPPVIEKFGDVRSLTKSLGATGMNDPGSGAMSMTGL